MQEAGNIPGNMLRRSVVYYMDGKFKTQLQVRMNLWSSIWQLKSL